MTSTQQTKARRGDLCAVVTTTHSFVIGQGSTEQTTVRLALVSSVTRDGVVKAFRPFWDQAGEPSSPITASPREQTLVLSADRIDVTAAITAYCARSWPTAPHSTSVRPCDSVDELRELLRPFLTAAAA